MQNVPQPEHITIDKNSDVTVKPSKLLFVVVTKAREWEIPNYLIPSVFISRFNVIVTKRDKSMFCK